MGQLQYCREICQKHYYNKILKECVEQSFPNTGHSETVILFYIRMKTVVNVLGEKIWIIIDAILMFNFSDCRAFGCQINFCCVIDRLLLATASN